MDIVFLVSYISFFSPLLSLGLSFRLKTVSYEIRLIQILMSVGFIIDLCCLILGTRGINTFPLGNIFFLIQSILFLLIYGNSLKIKKLTIPVTLCYSLVFLANYFFIQGPLKLNSFSHTLSSLIFILFSLLYFRYLLVKLPVVFVDRMPMVWINLSVLIYYSGNLFLFILNNYFTNGSDGNQRFMWIIHNSLNISKNLLLFIAIWQSLRKTNSYSS
jgi:hypothetical protein